ncbi:hypothetical protein RvY_11327 [Ramazzottius varieornatus]|uniref:Uncharacterized protein n=1 Tax=Ramazzottius varieornatus TaxID=947166 RepID=A0A1D1VL78_RAMVA|nr:hypothetical protein RvY_11327 [Ramazzottius varieornatus]
MDNPTVVHKEWETLNAQGEIAMKGNSFSYEPCLTQEERDGLKEGEFTLLRKKMYLRVKDFPFPVGLLLKTCYYFSETEKNRIPKPPCCFGWCPQTDPVSPDVNSDSRFKQPCSS